MIPLGTTCTLRRPLEHPVRVVVRGRTLEASPVYEVRTVAGEDLKGILHEWLEVDDGL